MKDANLTKDYYVSQKRFGNDIKRQKSFVIEKQYIQSLFHKRSLENLKILDIGCSTGEFVKSVFGDGKKIFGIEPSEFARNIASKNGIKIINDISEEDNFDLIISCIEQIYNDEESWSTSDCTKEEMNDFLDQLNSNQFKEIEKFFDTMPKLSHTLTVNNPNTKVKSDIKLEGLAAFFA